jgi:hypothetical protein
MAQMTNRPWRIGDPLPWKAPATMTLDKAPDDNGRLGILSGVALDGAVRAPKAAPQAAIEHAELFNLIERGGKQLTSEEEAKRQQAILAEIEMMGLRPYLKAELAAEMNTGGTATERREDLAKLDAYANEWGLRLELPHKAAPSTLVAAFLNREAEHGLKHAERLHRSISFSHRCFNLADPTSDIFVSAVMRQARHTQQSSPQTKEDNGEI